MGTLRQPLLTADPRDAGGAYVRRAFDLGERKLVAGNKLTKDEVASIPSANLNALVNTGMLQLWPSAPTDVFIAERFLIPAKGGKFEVIEGRKLTKGPVTKQYAQRLVAQG